VQEVPAFAWDLIELSDRPLTLIYDGAKNLAPNLIAPDGSIGIRVTNEPFRKRCATNLEDPSSPRRPISAVHHPRLVSIKFKTSKKWG